MKIRFTILIIFLLFLGYSLSASIIYHNVNPDEVITPLAAEYFIDMNSDAGNDFSIQNNVDAGNNIFEILFGCIGAGADVVGTDIGGVFCVSVLTNGTNIGAGSGFSGQAPISYPSLRTASYTSWLGQTNKFIGVKFMIGANTYYGWIRITVSGTNVVTVVDWAYNDIADGTIAAGDMGGGGTETLEANFLASSYNINIGECISFQDNSMGNPTFWSWTFDGAETPTSNLQNPEGICYYTPGVYDVTLNIQNATNTDTYICVGCITVIDQTIVPIANFIADQLVIPAGSSVQFTSTSQNGPFTSFAWAFEGGLPFSSTDETPMLISYSTPGVYDVQLTVVNTQGNEDTELKQDYIKVVPLSTELPTVNFIADRTLIAPGESVNFHDLSHGHPYQWEWNFQGGLPVISYDPNPEGIVFPNPGTYNVQLIAINSLGSDTLIRNAYITVTDNPTCTAPPVPNFRASNRLIVASNKVYFEDFTTNNPFTWNWYFEGGYPSYSDNSNITEGIEYNVPGIYDVTLAVNNSCGSNYLIKNDYIYVFTGPVSVYCDSLRNLGPDEVVTTVPVTGWGHIAGHNSQRVKAYADYFEDHSFTQIEGLVVPVRFSDYGSIFSYVKFFIWDGSTTYPDSVLAEKKVLIKDIPDNFYSVITFDEPVEINGPFMQDSVLIIPTTMETASATTGLL